MPPVRGPVNTKGLKTERTHEENQERAYIAASRRSDRSLEARIESARRASEIHKKRTGRALRVTEQDVINEEMYEEEDDDLQSQYRRLQAHLGSSADIFHGRLNAWVLSQYGTRQLALAAQNGMSFNQPTMNMQQPITPFFAYNPQAQSPPGTLSPGATQRQPTYRQSPYPQPFHRVPEQRSQSMDNVMNSPIEPHMLHQRRHSMASRQGDLSSIPGTPQPQTDSARPSVTAADSGVQPGHLGHPAFFNDQAFSGMMSPQFNFGGFPIGTSSYDPMMGSQLQSPINPLTTSLPVETQQVIGTSFDPTSQYTQMFMNQSHGQPVPLGINYTYRPNFGSLKTGSEGINQTLSPNPLTVAPTKIETSAEITPTLTNNSLSSGESLSNQFSSNNNLSFDGTFGLGMNFDKTPGDTNAAGTPNDGFFNDWVECQNEVA